MRRSNQGTRGGTEVLAILKKFDALNAEEKNLKKSVKDQETTLQLDTKHTIESLQINEALALLAKKWKNPMVTEISALPLQYRFSNKYRKQAEDCHNYLLQFAILSVII